jgi:putative endonuclease
VKIHRQKVGRWGENIAAAYLENNGYSLLARNFRTAHGEIDIIGMKGDLLVFVEVKTRRSHIFAYPEDSVTLRKQSYLLSAAEEYLQNCTFPVESWQFDVITVEGAPGKNTQINHFENVIGQL